MKQLKFSEQLILRNLSILLETEPSLEHRRMYALFANQLMNNTWTSSKPNRIESAWKKVDKNN